MTLSELKESKRLIDPIDRISEILFGLIMALTFTCTLSVAESSREDVKLMLTGAIGCNIAWGLVDAVMYLMSVLAYRGHGARILRYIKQTDNHHLSRAHIGAALPQIVTEALTADQLEGIRLKLAQIPENRVTVKLTGTDIKTSLGIFLLVLVSTFPIALPFIFIQEAGLAVRVSNFIAIVLMFFCGWILAGYGGYNKWWMSIGLTLFGTALVMITILLGG